MSQDPFLDRESEKYANPIPSREFILDHLAKREKPASRDELAIELNIEGEEQQEALRRRLRAMERDGQLVFTRRQCYALPERLDLLKGTVMGPQLALTFPPGSSWICFSDQTPHAAMGGQFMLEQTFLLPVNKMQDPQRSPLKVLEQLRGQPLI